MSGLRCTGEDLGHEEGRIKLALMGRSMFQWNQRYGSIPREFPFENTERMCNPLHVIASSVREKIFEMFCPSPGKGRRKTQQCTWSPHADAHLSFPCCINLVTAFTVKPRISSLPTFCVMFVLFRFVGTS